MFKSENRKFRVGANSYLRRIAVMFAALPLALLAFVRGGVELAAVTNINAGFLLVMDGWVISLFNGIDGVLEGFLLVTLAAGLVLLVFDRCQRFKLLEQEKKKYVEGKTRIGLQMEALNRHSIISEADANGRYIYVNENWEKIFEYSLAEAIGQKDSLLLDEGTALSDFDRIRERLKKGDVVSVEQRLRTKSGKLIVTNTTVLPKTDKDGNFLGTIAIRSDVTAARQAANDRFLMSVLKGLTEELYIYSVRDHGILFMNDPALERCEWSQDESKTKTIADTSKYFDISTFQKHVAPLLTGDADHVKIQAKHEKGWVEIGTTIQSQQDGTPIFVSILRDINDAKMEETRRMQNVATVSHELRSPMTSIKGSLRLLKSGAVGALPGDIGRLVDIADRNSDRMLLVLNDILDFEKIVANKMEYDMTHLCVADLIREAIEMNAGFASEHAVEFVKGSVIDQAWINADQGRLMQVMTNLMSNAAKFSPAGGKVMISVSDQGDSWRISVSDKGPGIPPEDRDKVFQSFSQLTPTDGKQRKGTGLGLAISARIVAAHHGSLDFDSVVGEGTTFFFDLPKAKEGGSTESSDVAFAAE